MNTDAAVRSIRVASALVDRFRAIIETKSISVAELELLIGESQQLYPEIWRHLDDARRELVRLGREVDVFDHIRAGELAALGVTNIDITREVDVVALMLGRYRERYTKTATFNIGGYQRAREAVAALMATLPEIDWAALEREEARQIAAAGSLETRKWLGIVKYAALAAGVIVAGVVIFRLVTSVKEDAPVSRRRRAEPIEAVSERVKQRDQRIGELRRAYAATCDRAQLPELLRLLREAAYTRDADQLEHGPCKPRPPCDTAREAIAARVATDHALVRDDAFRLRCEGVVARAGQGLAIVVTARGSDHKQHVLRGVVSPDGARELVSFAESPAPMFVGLGDLDDNNTDELVFVGGQKLVVSRIENGRFVDIAGPKLPATCQANVNVESDFRNGQQGEHKRLIITVDDPAPRKGCPPTGRHYYTLAGDALVESN